jgi:membrane-associated phospholipid phosphatase
LLLFINNHSNSLFRLKKYFVGSAIILALFVTLSILVSPKFTFNGTITNSNNNNRSASPIIRADSISFVQINNSHSKVLNQLMILLTRYGREVFWPVAIILLFVLGGWTGKKTAIVIAISMIVLVPIGIIAKDAVARPRPIIPKSDYLIAADAEFAFPSGHALIVSAGATVALLLFNNTPRRIVVSLALALEAALVCISRVYVGGHYPLDVLGGILLGVGVSMIFVGTEKSIDILIKPLRKKILKR